MVAFGVFLEGGPMLKKYPIVFFILVSLSVLAGCDFSLNSSDGDSAENDNSDDTNDDGSVNDVEDDSTAASPLTLATLENIFVRTDFGSEAFKATKFLELSMDCSDSDGVDQAGVYVDLDCDENGGAVAYQTPTYLGVAFKGFYLVPAGTTPSLDNTGEMIAIIDNATLIPDVALAEGDVLEFTAAEPEASLSIPADALDDFPADTQIIGYFAIIYYYDMEIQMYGETRRIRVYVSDDEFTRDGGAHHQGDITHFYDIETDTFDAENPERWAYGGNNWFYDNAGDSLNRGSFANGAGGTDPETTHDRGMFGGTDFWNQSDFMQGVEQDDYFLDKSFDELEGVNIQITFGIANSWYFENFVDAEEEAQGGQSFDPCYESSLEGCGATWSINPPDVSAEVIE
jgi:hypothetical protein